MIEHAHHSQFEPDSRLESQFNREQRLEPHDFGGHQQAHGWSNGPNFMDESGFYFGRVGPEVQEVQEVHGGNMMPAVTSKNRNYRGTTTPVEMNAGFGAYSR